MQISTSSLLAAQQARTPAQPRAPQAAQTQDAKEALFEPMLFGSKSEAPLSVASALTAAPATPSAATTAPFARPGSQIDIKV